MTKAELRDQLMHAMASAYTKEQFDAIVRRLLPHQLDYYAVGPNMVEIVDQFIQALQPQTDDFLNFLFQLKSVTTRPALKYAIDYYLSGKAPADPYGEYVIGGSEPFINRHSLRNKLRSLISTATNSAMIVRGERFSGRSHSKWLIQYAARQQDATVVTLDMSEYDTQGLVDMLIDLLDIPEVEFRDRMAKHATIARGFRVGLQRHLTKMPSRYCIVFDHFDRDEVTADAREFVNNLIDGAINGDFGTTQIIVLGHTGTLPVSTLRRVLDEQLLPLQANDVEQFVIEFAAQTGIVVTNAELLAKRDEILADLHFPLDLDGMHTLWVRLKACVPELSVA